MDFSIPHLRPSSSESCYPVFIDFHSATEMHRAGADLRARQDAGDLLPGHRAAQNVWMRDNKIVFTVWNKEKEEEEEMKRAKRRCSEKADEEEEEAHSDMMARPEHIAKKPRLEKPLGSGSPDTVPPKRSLQETARETVADDEDKALDRKALREWWIRERGIWLDI